jgi:predicted nucleic acid-binding protein
VQSARQGPEHARGEPASLFVDSGAWIALASVRDRHHAEADSLFRIAATLRLPLLTTNLVVADVHRFLLHRAGIAVAARALDRLEGSPRLTVEFVRPEHHRAARKWLARLGDHPISYTDAVSFAVMTARRCRTALSFDRHFRIAGFELWRSA